MVHDPHMTLMLRIRHMLSYGMTRDEIVAQLPEEDQGFLFLCYQAALMVQADDEKGGLLDCSQGF
jgi:hypothetical protein